MTGPPGQRRTCRISANLAPRTNLGFAEPSCAPYLVVGGSGNYFSVSPASGATVTKFRPQSNGFQELTFFLTPIGFQSGVALNTSDRVFLPGNLNSPRPRSAFSVYAPVHSHNPTSDYRRARVIRGG